MSKQRLLVIDSSVAVKWIIIKDELYVKQADKILEDTKTESVKIFMPELAKYEIGNVLLNKKLILNDIKESMNAFYKIPIKFYEEEVNSTMSIIRIAYEFGITFYDAAFIALAEKLKADLVTDNPKHQNRYKGKQVKIISLKDYR